MIATPSWVDFFGCSQISTYPPHHLPIAFTSCWGTFAHKRMPFELCNSPKNIHRLGTNTLQKFLHHTMELFLDELFLQFLAL